MNAKHIFQGQPAPSLAQCQAMIDWYFKTYPEMARAVKRQQRQLEAKRRGIK